MKLSAITSHHLFTPALMGASALVLLGCALLKGHEAQTAECLDCAVTVLVDALAGDSLTQIVADVTPCVTKCGEDALPLVVSTLAGSLNPRVRDTPAAKDARTLRDVGAVK